MKHMYRRLWVQAGLVAAVLGPWALSVAKAQEVLPKGPITLVVPFAAGGATDVASPTHPM